MYARKLNLPALIEKKSTQNVTTKHLSGLRALQEEGMFRNYYVVSRDPYSREIETGIRNVFWKDFLTSHHLCYC